MVKFLLKITLLCFMGATVAISFLHAIKPKELYRDQVAVLMYHHLHDEDRSSGTITPKLFRDQLTYLRSQGYRFITLSEFKHFLQGSPVPDNAVLITFDDGYESFYNLAYPILKELAAPAVNFVITGKLDDSRSGYIPFMNGQQLSALSVDRGFIDIECHTDSLHDKTGGKALLTHRLTKKGHEETDSEFHARLVTDTNTCKQKVRNYFPENGDSIAYPFGIYSEAAIRAVSEGGIKYGFTILPKMATRDTDPMRIPRINAGSPSIRPETLHNMIMRRVSSVKHPHATVPLRETIEQIGGDLVKDEERGNLVIRYIGNRHMISRDRSSVTNLETGVSLKLARPMKLMGSRIYVDLNELQRILKVSIYYDSDTRTYTTRAPLESDVDVDVDIMKPYPKGY